MVATRFNEVITSEEQLRDIFGWPADRAVNKQLDHLDKHCRTIIEKSPFVLFGTSDGTRCDVSPKGDAPGFIRVLDDKTIAVPDLPGNNRLDTLTNLIANPNVGMIFMVPGMNETLRINGRVTLVRDADLLQSMAVGNKLPKLAIVVDVEEVFTHCPKAFIRSNLWDSETWTNRSEIASYAEILRDHVGIVDCDLDELQAELDERIKTTLH
ncbi:MAG: pyridoxamine 5'-phosphate oxidase family protein [Chloroflexi bacterium]|nr:pyridoxamine 5'-phosphate oxidase family protein [Chloroflexota bacterium]MDA1226530.1 pyridoxamine 5'-phosphate oxidase family protein [Chloroflexota bacterium]